MLRPPVKRGSRRLEPENHPPYLTFGRGLAHRPFPVPLDREDF